MFFHLLKPLWKRKFKNMLLTVEILLAFVVVFAVAALGLRYWQLYQMPVGFQYDSVWSISVRSGEDNAEKLPANLPEQFLRALKTLPEVEQVAFANYTPFEMSTWSTHYQRLDGSQKTRVELMQVSDDFFSVMSMQTVQGRFFSHVDEAPGQQSVVLNRAAAAALFPGQNAVGQLIRHGAASDKNTEILKVTGIVDEFRNRGDFMTPTNFVLVRQSLLGENAMLRTILIKLKPGTPRLFEARLSQQLKLVRNDWGYRIAPLADLRSSLLREQSTPLLILSILAGFLLLMVAFGLFGVLWQNTTQRIPEIGLRRAVGAHAGHIYRQIISEQLLLCSLAMLLALVLLIQLPLTGLLGANLNWTVFVSAVALAALVIYAVALLCSLYPAWRASQLSPTQALHYE